MPDFTHPAISLAGLDESRTGSKLGLTGSVVATPPASIHVHIEIFVAVEAIAESKKVGSIVIKVFLTPIVEVTRQTVISTRRAMAKAKSIGTFIRSTVTGAAVLAYIVTSADSFWIIGNESSRRALVGIGASPDSGRSGMTILANSRLWQVSKSQTGEGWKGVTTRAVFGGDMRSRWAIFLVAAVTGSRRRRMIEWAQRDIEFWKAMAADAVLLQHMGR